MNNLTAYSEITIIETIVSGPTLSSELLATKNERVEHAQSEQKGFVFFLFVFFSLFELILLELGEGTTQVSLQVLRSFVSNFNGVLKNSLRNDFLVIKWWWLRSNEDSEFGMTIGIDSNFNLTLETSHPVSHEMHVLKHDPFSVSCGIYKAIFSNLFLTLSH